MGFIHSLPIALEESAYIDGCNVVGIYFKIIMPIAKPAFATVAIFTFLWSYNDLFTQMFLLRYPKEKTITLLLNEISSQAGVNYGLMASIWCVGYCTGFDSLCITAKKYYEGLNCRCNKGIIMIL